MLFPTHTGNYAVLRGRYIDYETCPVPSYQPFLFRSNELYKCAYLKSMCSSDGQVEVNDGTITSDKACRCDFKRGFAFVIRPQNQSACIPSQEDCSCYSKRCEIRQHLNPGKFFNFNEKENQCFKKWLYTYLRRYKQLIIYQ